MQTAAAAVRWPVTDAVEAELLAAMAVRLHLGHGILIVRSACSPPGSVSRRPSRPPRRSNADSRPRATAVAVGPSMRRPMVELARRRGKGTKTRSGACSSNRSRSRSRRRSRHTMIISRGVAV